VVEGSIPSTGIRRVMQLKEQKTGNQCSLTKLSFRVVKGGGLKIRCASFVGSNPTSTIFTFQQSVRQIIGNQVACPSSQRRRPQVLLRKLRGCKSHRNQSLFSKDLCSLGSVAELRSYESKVVSSNLTVNMWSSSWTPFDCLRETML
jgi:hypothetical protein